MVKTKHVADVSQKVEAYFDALPANSREICMKLREIVLKSDPSVKEEWEWTPVYYTKGGALCGITGFKNHVNFVFFRGSLLADEKQLFSGAEESGPMRLLRLENVSEIDEALLLAYMHEAIYKNRKSKKLLAPKEKSIETPEGIAAAFKEARVLNYFENLAYSHRREYILWIMAAKQEETRLSRISKAIGKLSAREMLHDK